jgi:hypothetical protein
MKANTQSDVLSDLIDRETAAHLLGVAPRTLDRWHLQHVGPPRLQIGRKVRYLRTSLDVWVRGLEKSAQKSA